MTCGRALKLLACALAGALYGCADADAAPSSALPANPHDAGVESESDAASAAACAPDESAPVPESRCTSDPSNSELPPCERWLKVEPQGATCSDGSPYKFFVNYSGQSNNLVIVFEPGGACWDYASCSGGARGAANPHGIADNHMERFQFLNLLRRDSTNPVASWNMVFVSYCTGDVHGGNRVATYEDPGGGAPLNYRHVGRDNTQKMIEWASTQFTSIPKLLVTGCSAGGIGALQNYAFVREGLPGAQCGYLLDDSGPAFHSDGPSAQQHAQVTAAWGTEQVLDTLQAQLGIDGAAIKDDFGLINTVVADRYPRDRLALTVYQMDLNYSLYAYERFYPMSSEARIHELWMQELTPLMRTFDSRPNLAYFVPYFRPDNCSHCVSIPPLARDEATILSTPWLGTEIQERGLDLYAFTELLLDDGRPLDSYRETPIPAESFTAAEAAECMAMPQAAPSSGP